jgi:glycosyltransferase involved in cell wall biosynthesis
MTAGAGRGRRPEHGGDPADLDLTVVVPFYNPGGRLHATIEDLLAGLEVTGQSFEVIAVSDGSTDGSARTVDDLRGDRFRVVELDHNYGKGQALRVGMGLGTGAYVGFIDADGDIPPYLMARFAELAAREHPDGILGSKIHPDSAVHLAPLRHMLSLSWRALVRLLFQFPVSDSQAGIKLFRCDVVRDALPRTNLRGFAFDLELLVIARDLGYSRFIEAPIEISERDSSTISLRTACRMLADMGVIFWRTRLVRSHVRRVGGST